MADDDARALFAEAQRVHATGRARAGLDLARRALALDPGLAAAREHVATVLLTRLRLFDEGLREIDRAVEIAPGDAGLWYARGWCYEFAAHELRRRPPGPATAAANPPAPGALYTEAADSFRRCLALAPEGKLRDDAADLLDHVENELASM